MIERVSVADRNKNKPDINQLFDTTPVQDQKKAPVKYVRGTYYLTEEILEAIRECAYIERKDKSEVIREILLDSKLKQYMPK